MQAKPNTNRKFIASLSSAYYNGGLYYSGTYEAFGLNARVRKLTAKRDGSIEVHWSTFGNRTGVAILQPEDFGQIFDGR